MNYTVLSATAEKAVSAVESIKPLTDEAIDKAVSFGLPFSLFGFATVFCVLALIMLIVIIFGKIFGVKQQKPAKEVKKVEKVENKPEPKAEEVPAAAVNDDGGIIAAIVAAVSAFRAANGTSGGFRVVSFKKRK